MRRNQAPRDICSVWASKTFGEAAKKAYLKEPQVISYLENQLGELKLTDKPVNGYAVEGLQQTQEGRGSAKISYTDTFFEVLKKKGSCNPIDYLYLLVKKAHSEGQKSEKVTGILARSMRTYASLLRDRDFAFFLQQEIAKKQSFRNYEVVTDAFEDSKNHTDVLVKIDGKAYRIWLFQFTSRGLPNDIERITGERGSLPKGVHILCPLKTADAKEYSKTNGKIRKVESKLEKIDEDVKEANEGTKKLRNLETRKEGYREELAELEKRMELLSKKVAPEVEIREGWYFYPRRKVQEVLRMIKHVNDGKRTPEEYENVCRILNAPKKLLSEISSFEI
jgi:hypothetical protein